MPGTPPPQPGSGSPPLPRYFFSLHPPITLPGPPYTSDPKNPGPQRAAPNLGTPSPNVPTPLPTPDSNRRAPARVLPRPRPLLSLTRARAEPPPGPRRPRPRPRLRVRAAAPPPAAAWPRRPRPPVAPGPLRAQRRGQAGDQAPGPALPAAECIVCLLSACSALFELSSCAVYVAFTCRLTFSELCAAFGSRGHVLLHLRICDRCMSRAFLS